MTAITDRPVLTARVFEILKKRADQMTMPGVFGEAMEELRLLGAIDALKTVLECKFESEGEGCEVVTAEDIQEQLLGRQRALLSLRTSD